MHRRQGNRLRPVQERREDFGGAGGWCSWKAAGDAEHRAPDNRLKDDSNYERSLLIVALALAIAFALALTLAFAFPLTLAFSLALVLALAFAFALAFALRRGVENRRCGDGQQYCAAADDPLQETAASGINAIEQLVFAHLSFTSF